MIKYSVSAILRNFGLIRLTDKLRFYYFYVKTIGSRKRFRKEYPGIKTPPPYYLYETFNLNYFSYYHGSKESADRLAVFFNNYKGLENLKVLDWGCGPGRVIRHLPSIMDPSCQFYGTDYNIKYIEWCKKNIPGVAFSHNSLSPPLDYEYSTFDIVYGISIFTHLSEKMHFAWFNELIRILKPGGIVLISVHGNAFRIKLTNDERARFDEGRLVVKSRTKVGHRTYAAFQPDQFIRELVGNNEILKHVEGKNVSGNIQQDIWIVEKRA